MVLDPVKVRDSMKPTALMAKVKDLNDERFTLLAMSAIMTQNQVSLALFVLSQLESSEEEEVEFLEAHLADSDDEGEECDVDGCDDCDDCGSKDKSGQCDEDECDDCAGDCEKNEGKKDQCEDEECDGCSGDASKSETAEKSNRCTDEDCDGCEDGIELDLSDKTLLEQEVMKRRVWLSILEEKIIQCANLSDEIGDTVDQVLDKDIDCDVEELLTKVDAIAKEIEQVHLDITKDQRDDFMKKFSTE